MTSTYDSAGPRRSGERAEPDPGAAPYEAGAGACDGQARDELLQSHIEMAHGLARRFSGSGPPDDDLVQVASLALLKAIDRYDPERGVAFANYAWVTVLGELRHHLRDRGWAVRVPRRAKDLRLHLRWSAEELRQRFRRSPTRAELARDLGVGGRELDEALEAGRCRRALPVEPLEDDESAGAVVAVSESGFDLTESRDLVAPLLQRLPVRERRVMWLRFVDELSQAEIAKRLGISQMHVSRLLARSLSRLRTWARARPE